MYRPKIVDGTRLPIINNQNYLMLILIAIITSISCYYLVNKTANTISNKLSKINYTRINIGLLAFITGLVLAMSGWIGLIVLATATLIGLKTTEDGVNQTQLMAALIIPTIIYYLG